MLLAALWWRVVATLALVFLVGLQLFAWMRDPGLTQVTKKSGLFDDLSPAPSLNFSTHRKLALCPDFFSLSRHQCLG
jgi:hypothetical protein